MHSGRAAEPRGAQRERLRCGHGARPRSPILRPQPPTTQAQLRGKAEAEEAVVAKARGFAEQVRRTALHTAAPASHPHANWQCTVYRAMGAAGVAQTQRLKPKPEPEPTPAPALAPAPGGGDAGARDTARGGGRGEQPSQGATRAGRRRTRANHARRPSHCSRRARRSRRRRPRRRRPRRVRRASRASRG